MLLKNSSGQSNQKNKGSSNAYRLVVVTDSWQREIPFLFCKLNTVFRLLLAGTVQNILYDVAYLQNG